MRTIIKGQCPSKSNGYQITGNGMIKSKALKDYERSFYLQCDQRDRMIPGLFEIEVDAYFKTMSNDLDGIFKILLDCLQQCRVIKNDNRCVRINARKFVDRVNPRVEFSLVDLSN